MTAMELAKAQSDAAVKKIEMVLAAMEAEGANHRAHPEMMTPSEIIAHLSETYVALDAHLEGRNHQWGSYSGHPEAWEAGIETFRALRANAVDKAVADGSDHAVELVSDYIVHHDNYHLGQLVTTKLSLDPSWNSHQLYQ